MRLGPNAAEPDGAYDLRVRIVSLLPSTTEILFDLGAGDHVVGVTFECDHPVEARSRTVVSTSAMPEGLDPGGDRRLRRRRDAAGEDLYHLDEGALPGLDADLVVTQDLCAVCAVDVSVVDDALAHLGCTAEVLTIDPHTLEEVLASVGTLGKATGTEARADRLVASLRARLDDVVRRVAGRPRPRTLVLEWTDPAFAPGHWVPEMVDLAGGSRVLGTPGAKSYRVGLGRGARAAEPEVVVCAPCGFGLEQSVALAEELVGTGELPPGAACGRSTPTRRSPGPGRGWSTAWRRWPASFTPTWSSASPIAARRALRRAAGSAARARMRRAARPPGPRAAPVR